MAVQTVESRALHFPPDMPQASDGRTRHLQSVPEDSEVFSSAQEIIDLTHRHLFNTPSDEWEVSRLSSRFPGSQAAYARVSYTDGGELDVVYMDDAFPNQELIATHLSRDNTRNRVESVLHVVMPGQGVEPTLLYTRPGADSVSGVAALPHARNLTEELEELQFEPQRGRLHTLVDSRGTAFPESADRRIERVKIKSDLQSGAARVLLNTINLADLTPKGRRTLSKAHSSLMSAEHGRGVVHITRTPHSVRR